MRHHLILYLILLCIFGLSYTYCDAQFTNPHRTSGFQRAVDGLIKKTQAKDLQPASRYEVILDSAESCASRHDFNGAAEWYRKALREKPSSPLNDKIFSNLGICLTHTGAIREALEAFDIALVRNPDSPEILTSRASAYIVVQDYSEAIKDLDSALAADPNYSPALSLRGRLHLTNGNLELASADFIELRSTDPRNSWGYSGVGRILFSQGNYDEALQMLRKGMELENDPETVLTLILCLMEKNRLAEASDIINEQISLNPREPDLYIARALLRRNLYLIQEAEEDFKTAQRLGADPTLIAELKKEQKK
ncbi:MAG: tetratricopeptide repeat protein [Bacteroides sp.]|nr:tetratricopeptide repeat protein [Bacteroides sp.]